LQLLEDLPIEDVHKTSFIYQGLHYKEVLYFHGDDHEIILERVYSLEIGICEGDE